MFSIFKLWLLRLLQPDTQHPEVVQAMSDQISEIVSDAVQRATRDGEETLKLAREAGALQKRITELEQQKATLQEDIDRRTRETEHKLGLERKRQEFEHQQAQSRAEALEARLKADASVSVREARVGAREEAMAKANENQREHLERLEKLVDTLVTALPKAEILAKIGGGHGNA